MNTMFDFPATQSSFIAQTDSPSVTATDAPADTTTGTSTAQPTTTPGTPTVAPTGGGGGGQFVFLALMVGMIAFMFLTSRSTKKREARKREELYASLSKNNRVLTVGGVIGTIMSVKDNEVVLKVDETTNTKMTFLKSAIQRTITDGDVGSGD